MIKMKKIDYTNSAVNLCNPPELRHLLLELRALKAQENALQTELEWTKPFSDLRAKQEEIANLEKSIREAIDSFGSYQDLDTGDYAIKQKKLSITYVVSRVKDFLRTYADAVIEEVVSKPKLEGLHKGGLISQADLDRCSEYTESFAFIIKTS